MEAAAAAAAVVATTAAAGGTSPTTTTREGEAGPRSRADDGDDDSGPREYDDERGDDEIPTDSKTATVVFRRSLSCSSASSRSRSARYAGS